LDLDHQAGVMYAIHNFVDECLNFDMPKNVVKNTYSFLERKYAILKAY
jgi:hypothetical protein